MEGLLLTEKIKRSLRANWGPAADSLNCYAEVKYQDNKTGWEWYLLALNPEDDDTIKCIVMDTDLRVCTWTLTELGDFYNSDGESPVMDLEYRRQKADVLYKKLMQQI